MPIKRRKIRISPAVQKRKKLKSQIAEQDAALERMGEILAAGHGTEADARLYFTFLYTKQLSALQSIAAKAESERNWNFMRGSVKQATDLYVLASVLYEKFPEHVMLSDGAFDGLARWLLTQKKRGKHTKFWTWYNVTSMGLKAGSGYNLVARNNIRWMVFLLTGTDMGDENEQPTQDSTRLLRRTIKRTRKRGTGDTGSAAGKRLRKSKE